MAAEAKENSAVATIRHYLPEDAEAVAAVGKESPEAADWSASSYRNLSRQEGVLAIVSETEGNVTGFLFARRVGNEGEILNLAVTPARRRRGKGKALLESALEEFRLHGVTRVFLEVREANKAAAAFYVKQGFVKTGRRPGYYRNPEEAAVLMERKLTG